MGARHKGHLHCGCGSAGGLRFGAAGCAAASPLPPEPRKVWSKEGAWTNEEFQRTRARCIMYAATNQARNAWGGPFGNSWALLATACMRAEGWVLVPEKPGR